MRPTVNEYLVGAATELSINYCAVHQRVRAIFGWFYMRVIARCAWVIKHYRVVWGAAYGARAIGQQAVLPLAAACVGDLQECHDELARFRNEREVQHPNAGLCAVGTPGLSLKQNTAKELGSQQSATILRRS